MSQVGEPKKKIYIEPVNDPVPAPVEKPAPIPVEEPIKK